MNDGLVWARTGMVNVLFALFFRLFGVVVVGVDDLAEESLFAIV